MFNGLKVKIMKKKVLFAAMALIALASCSSDEIASLSSPPESTAITDSETSEAIVFSSASKGITRADITGAAAADLLGGAFVVSGYKGDATATVTSGGIVFDNYLVMWRENTANTTESNTTNWEYVGVTPIKHATDNGITSQRIKYWDYSVNQYDFIAWSTGSKTAIYEGTPTDGQVLVSEITPGDATTAAYTFEGKAADLSECYIADLVTVNKYASPAPGIGEDAPYGKAVTFKFRQLGTKVRIGIYETVPGYSVKDVKFYSAAASDDASSAKARLFTTVTGDIYTEGTYTVSFPTVDHPEDADNNQAHVTFAPKSGVAQKTIVDDWGGLNYTIAEEGEKTEGNVFLGRTSNTASFAGDADDNYYEIYLPNQTGTNLNLRVDYTLESIDGSGEVINVKGATAQVPSIYAQWKPGFAYTYLFKISDKTNGHTGYYDPLFPDDVTVNSDPAGLYPITFDAVVVDAEEGNTTQETITLVATPSITTYQKGSNVVNNNEYKAATGDIFVTVNDGGGYVEVTGLEVGVSSVSDYYTFNTTTGKYAKCGPSDLAQEDTKYYRLDPVLANGDLQTLTGKAAVYEIPEGKTEADVVDALQMQDEDVGTYTIKGRSGLGLTEVTSTLTNTIEYGVDGNAISVGTDQALRFDPYAGTFAFVYTKKAATNEVPKYQALAWSEFGSKTKYRYDYEATSPSYDNDNGTPSDASDDTKYFDAQKGVKYFAEAGGVYTMQTPFIGQGVGNLYLDDAGNNIASGYAKSEVTYYYSYIVNSVKHYKAAHPVTFATNMLSGLYEETTPGNYIETSDTGLPTDGKAYYFKSGDNYIYCVFLPQQTSGWYVLDTDTYVLANETSEVNGQTYFDKYTQNDGVYYTKVIKVE